MSSSARCPTARATRRASRSLLNEWLGVPIDKVRLITGDTDIVKVGGGTHSGRGMRLAQHRDLEGRQAPSSRRASRSRRCCCRRSPRRSTSHDGRFTAQGAGGSMTLAEVAAAMGERTDLPPELRGPLDRGVRRDRQRRRLSLWLPCLRGRDRAGDSARVRIVQHTAVDDVGRAVNPLIIHGQTHGGIAQGVGQALLEHCFYDAGTGQLAVRLVHGLRHAARRRAAVLHHRDQRGAVDHPSARHPAGRRGRHDAGARRRRSTRSSMRWPSSALSTSRCRRRPSASGAPCTASRSARECCRTSLSRRRLAAEPADEC